MNSKNNNKLIKLLSPSCTAEEINAVTKVLKSGWWGAGPVTDELEREFAKFVGVKYAVAVNSCTSALHLALKLVIKRLGGKGKVIVPALTFVSTAAPSLYEDCEVVFGDIDEETLCLDPKDVNRKLDKNTIAVVPVHYAGRLADMDYKKTAVTIIEDCAHAGGTKGAGKTGAYSAWSFEPIKNIATGNGGMLTTDDKEGAETARMLRWMGIERSTYERSKGGKYSWEYDIPEIGFKYQTNDILSAIALVQLRRLEELNARRKKIAKRYNKELADLTISLPPESGSWHTYVIRVEGRYRNKLIDYLKKNNISTSVYYKPLYYYPKFRWNIKSRGKELPVTQKIWRQVISLPIYPDLTEAEQGRVIENIRRFFRR